MPAGLFNAKKRVKRDEDEGWEIDTLDDNGSDRVDTLQPVLSRYRFMARALGYTQTEAGMRTAAQIVAEADEYARSKTETQDDLAIAIGDEVILDG